jgi:hypothetical protein
VVQNVGAPDWQRGTINAGKLLKIVPSGTLSTVVSVPPNAAALFVAMSQKMSNTTVAAIGTTTGFLYPLTFLPGATPYPYDTFIAIPVLTQLDAQVEIVFGVAPAVPWYIVSESTAELLQIGVMDLFVSESGAPTNPIGILSLGSDGTDSRALLTDATGKLVISNPGSGATPQPVNAALVSEGILAMGSDGTDGRIISTDANGRQIPLVPTLSVRSPDLVGIPNVLAAPTIGAWYLFGVDFYNASAPGPIECRLLSGTEFISEVAVSSGAPTVSVVLSGMRVTQSITGEAAGAGTYATLRYAPGP